MVIELEESKVMLLLVVVAVDRRMETMTSMKFDHFVRSTIMVKHCLIYYVSWPYEFLENIYYKMNVHIDYNRLRLVAIVAFERSAMVMKE